MSLLKPLSAALAKTVPERSRARGPTDPVDMLFAQSWFRRHWEGAGKGSTKAHKRFKITFCRVFSLSSCVSTRR